MKIKQNISAVVAKTLHPLFNPSYIYSLFIYFVGHKRKKNLNNEDILQVHSSVSVVYDDQS